MSGLGPIPCKMKFGDITFHFMAERNKYVIKFRGPHTGLSGAMTAHVASGNALKHALMRIAKDLPEGGNDV